MKGKCKIVICLLVILLPLVTSCDLFNKKLDRETADRILRESIEPNRLIFSIESGPVRLTRTDKTVPIKCLERLGIVKTRVEHYIPYLSYSGGYDAIYWEFTEEGKKYFGGKGTFNSIYIVYGYITYDQITGIVHSENSAQVEYRKKHELNPCAACYNHRSVNKVYHETFLRYDDGWRMD